MSRGVTITMHTPLSASLNRLSSVTPVGSARRVRLKRLLAICAVAVTLYLLTHLYINYHLTRGSTDDAEGRQNKPSIMTCSAPPVAASILKKLPSSPQEGIFYLPVFGSDSHMRESATLPRMTYLVDERFPPLLSSRETESVMRLVRKLGSLLSAAGVTFTLWQGSVLGSYMSHGLIPWDDDLDIAIRWEDMPKVKAALSEASTMWRVYNVTSFLEDGDLYSKAALKAGDIWGKSVPNPSDKPRYHRFKFFAIDSSPAGNTTWKWPNVDVVFYKENTTHIWTYGEPENTEYVARSVFYPLHKRPFGSLWLPAPADARTYLLSRYGHNFRCSTPGHNHRFERPRVSVEVPCCTLFWTYPTVHREAVFGGVIEKLLLGNETLHATFVKEEFISGGGPYQL